MIKDAEQEHTQEIHYWSLYSLTNSGEEIAKEIIHFLLAPSFIRNIKVDLYNPIHCL